MSAGRSKLPRKCEQVIACLLSEPTHAQAAAKAGISEATLQRWLLRPDFQAAYRQARRRLVENSLGRLQQATGKAVDALERNLACGHAATEVRAALGILEHSARAIELVDLMARVEALERRAVEAEDQEVPAPPCLPAGGADGTRADPSNV
jgi:hypothetical protein